MYVITGATGNTGRVVASELLRNGQRVRAIARNADHLQQLAANGAEPFVADLTDTAALAKAFAGAQAVYVMVPPNMTSPDYRAYQRRVGDSVVKALTTAKVQ